MSDATYYKWKAKYAGMDVSQLRRLKDLETENSRLKRMYADLSLTHQALQDAVEKSCNALFGFLPLSAKEMSLKSPRFTQSGNESSIPRRTSKRRKAYDSRQQ